MRIHDADTTLDGPTRTDATAATPGGSGRAKDAGRAAASRGDVSTTVVLSARAQELSAQTDPARSARVSALREQFQRGELRIDTHAIAAKLVGDDA
jgi:flagellar biosynthesis anti-sigma factor FlgM